MATIRLIPSTYSIINNSNLSVSNASNMYANTDNTTYATVQHTRSNATAYDIYLKGFNFDDIPSNAVINSFTVKLKAYERRLSTSSTYAPKLVNDTTTITSSCPALSTSAQTLTFTGVSADWDTIKGYGSNFGICVTLRRSSRYTTGYAYIYGAEILVDYTVPTYHTVSVTQSTGGTISLSQSGQVLEGTTITVTATPSDGYELENIYINGTALSGTSFIVNEDKAVSAVFNEPNVHYIKVDGRWRKVLTAYRKINGAWEEFNYTYDDSLQLKYLGHITSDVIGEVTSDYHIVITDTSIPNNTYYFYYEDANKTKLTDWDVIGSTEFNEYNGGTTTTGEEVGVINEDNSISLTNTSLANGTYTMYYENADGVKLEGWDSIGTVSK